MVSCRFEAWITADVLGTRSHGRSQTVRAKKDDATHLDTCALVVRGLYVATGQYFSLRVSAVVLTLGGDDSVEVVEDREQVDNEREKVEVRDKEKGDKTRTNNARSNI